MISNEPAELNRKDDAFKIKISKTSNVLLPSP